jgi:outer membrane protein assembly factor BamB
MSRTIPAVTTDYILSIGPRCHTMCLDRKSGELLWSIDIEKNTRAKRPSGIPVNARSSTMAWQF